MLLSGRDILSLSKALGSIRSRRIGEKDFHRSKVSYERELLRRETSVSDSDLSSP
jgi:hypothetical protein